MGRFQPTVDWNERLKNATDNFELISTERVDNRETRLIARCTECGTIRTINSVSFRTGKAIICRTCRHNKTVALRKYEKEKRIRSREVQRKRKMVQIEMNFCQCGQILPFGARVCDECKRKTKRKIERRKEYKRRIRIEQKTFDKTIDLNTLYERDGGVCYLCKKVCDWGDFQKINGAFIVGGSYPTIEHVFPLYAGGTHTWDNIKLACHSCNSKKGKRLTSPWL